MRRQRFNAFETLENTAARLARRLRPVGGLQEIVSGNFEGGGEAENHVGVEAELASLIIGDERLQQAGSFGELDLVKPRSRRRRARRWPGVSSLGGSGGSESLEGFGMTEAIVAWGKESSGSINGIVPYLLTE